MQSKKSSYPPTHILSPAFVYVPAALTDIRKTFQRARERNAAPLRLVPRAQRTGR